MRPALLLMACMLAAASAFAVTLADGGQARLVVVLPDAPAPEETEAASELVTYLGKLTGAAFEAVAEGALQARPAIFVGTTWASARHSENTTRRIIGSPPVIAGTV